MNNNDRVTTVNGLLWPAADTECRKVIFDWLEDLYAAIYYAKGRAVAVQAGGNTGVWPKKLAQFFDVVHTFEPDEDNYTCLDANCTEDNIVKYNAALGDRSCAVDLCREANNIGAHSIKGAGPIPMMTIDSLNLPRCDLIQLDVEGFEFFAISGGLETIKKYSPAIMVEEKGLSLNYNLEAGATLNLLSMHGYAVAAEVHRDFVMIRQ